MKNVFLFLCLFAVAGWSTNVTTSGNAEISSITSNGDFLTIRAQDSCWLAAGNSRALKITCNGKLSISGNLTLGYGPLTFGHDNARFWVYAGASINLVNDTIYGYNGGNFVNYMLGTSANPISVYSSGAGFYDISYATPTIAKYVNFVNTHTYFAKYDPQKNSIRHCTFFNSLLELKTSGTGSGIVDTIACTDFYMTIVPSSGQIINIINNNGSGYAYFDSCSVNYQGTSWPALRDAAVTSKFHNCAIKGISFDGLDTLISCAVWGITQNLPISPHYVDSCYIFTTVDNPHVFSLSGSSGRTYKNTIVQARYYDGFSDNGDVFANSQSATPTLNMENIVVVSPKSDQILNAVGYSWGGTNNIKNVTVLCNGKHTAGQISNESGGTWTGTLNIFNWLHFDRDASTPADFVSWYTAGANQLTCMEFNDLAQVGTTYNNGPTWSPPKTIGVDTCAGKHNMTVQPQFSDTTRNLITFNYNNYGVAKTGSSAHLDSLGFYRLLGINGYDSTNHVQSTPIMTAVKDFISWVLPGYAPMCTTLSTAGLLGGKVGAVTPAHGIRSGPAYSKTTTGATVPCTLSTNIDSATIRIDTATYGSSNFKLSYTGSLLKYGSTVQAELMFAHPATKYNIRARIATNQATYDTLPPDTITTVSAATTPQCTIYVVAGTHGTVNNAGPFAGDTGTTYKDTAKADTGYKFVNVTVRNSKTTFTDATNRFFQFKTHTVGKDTVDAHFAVDTPYVGRFDTTGSKGKIWLKLSDASVSSDALLTGKTPSNYSLPSGWNLVVADGAESSTPAAIHTASAKTATGSNNTLGYPYVAHSGTHAYSNKIAGDGDGAIVWITLPDHYTECYISFYEYCDQSALYGNSDYRFLGIKNNESACEIAIQGQVSGLLTNNVSSTNGLYFPLHGYRGTFCNSEKFWYNGPFVTPAPAINAGSWRQYEAWIRPNSTFYDTTHGYHIPPATCNAPGDLGCGNGMYKMWIDGNLVMDAENVALNDSNYASITVGVSAFVGGYQTSFASNGTTRCTSFDSNGQGTCPGTQPGTGGPKPYYRYHDDIIVLYK